MNPYTVEPKPLVFTGSASLPMSIPQNSPLHSKLWSKGTTHNSLHFLSPLSLSLEMLNLLLPFLPVLINVSF